MKRLHERGHDEESVFAILDAGLIAHIGYVIDGQPYVTPTAYWRRGRTLYWHGSSASRMLRTQAKDIPVCVTVTLLDGLVMARSGFHHSINYRAVMAFGRAHIIDDPKEKEAELDFHRAGLSRPPGNFAPRHHAGVEGHHHDRDGDRRSLGENAQRPSERRRRGLCARLWAGVIGLKTIVTEISNDGRLAPGTAEDLAAFTKDADFGELLKRYKNL